MAVTMARTFETLEKRLTLTCDVELCAIDDQFNVPEGQPTELDLLANDQLPVEPLSVEISQPPKFGRLDRIAGETALRFVPARGYVGPDSFSYLIRSEAGESEPAVVDLVLQQREFPWQNPIAPLDVNADRLISAIDVLIIVNELNEPVHSEDDGHLAVAPASPNPAPAYLDVNGDGGVHPLDPLQVINWINTSESPYMQDIGILSLGDSITAGCHDSVDSPAYRFRLQDYMFEAGIGFDMLGDERRSCSRSAPYDFEHEGHGGFRIEQITEVAAEAIPKFEPDVVFLLAGTNNHWSDPDYDAFVDRYSNLLDEIGDRPVFIGTVPKFGYDRPNTSYWTTEWVDGRNSVQFPNMNRAIRDVAASRDNVWVVDIFEEFDPAIHLVQDAVHPNSAGQTLIGDLFWASASNQLDRMAREIPGY